MEFKQIIKDKAFENIKESFTDEDYNELIDRVTAHVCKVVLDRVTGTVNRDDEIKLDDKSGLDVFIAEHKDKIGKEIPNSYIEAVRKGEMTLAQLKEMVMSAGIA